MKLIIIILLGLCSSSYAQNHQGVPPFLHGILLDSSTNRSLMNRRMEDYASLLRDTSKICDPSIKFRHTNLKVIYRELTTKYAIADIMRKTEKHIDCTDKLKCIFGDSALSKLFEEIALDEQFFVSEVIRKYDTKPSEAKDMFDYFTLMHKKMKE